MNRADKIQQILTFFGMEQSTHMKTEVIESWINSVMSDIDAEKLMTLAQKMNTALTSWNDEVDFDNQSDETIDNIYDIVEFAKEI